MKKNISLVFQTKEAAAILIESYYHSNGQTFQIFRFNSIFVEKVNQSTHTVSGFK